MVLGVTPAGISPFKKFNRKKLSFFSVSRSLGTLNASKEYFLTLIASSFRITHLTNYITVNPGENAELVCSVDANPIKIDTVKWLREGFDFEAKTRLTNVSNINFYLTVINVTEGDAGQFTCQVNNGIGETISNSTFLLVRREYYNTSKSCLFLDRFLGYDFLLR